MANSVHYSQLLPHEFRARLAAFPVGYLPLGTLEWHGEHSALGTDALISGGIMARAAERFGGIVFPPLFVGPDRIRREPDGTQLLGMEYAESTTPPRLLEGGCYWVPEGLFLMLCEAIVAQAARAGFRALFADGHGPSRFAWGRGSPGWAAQYGITLISVVHDLRDVWPSQIDHAARNETSLMLALHGDLVDLSQLPADRSVYPQGVGGPDPRDSDVAYGEECIATCLDALGARLAQALGR
jgi:creatinine amidohydrolase